VVTPASMDPGAGFANSSSTPTSICCVRWSHFADALMSADVDAVCGAEYGTVTDERVNRRNGYRRREWDTRAGTVELSIPKLRQGSYFPSWLLEPRRRAEQALVQVIADCYLAGVSTRRVDKLVKQLGLDGISKSQVSELAKNLDETVEGWRSRPLDASPYTYVWMDALTQKVREGGRIVNVAVVHAVGRERRRAPRDARDRRDHHRGRCRLDRVPAQPGGAWAVGGAAGDLRRPRRAQGRVAAVLPGASWQRCRTHFMRNLLSRVPSPPTGWSRRWSARSSSSPTPTRPGPNTPAWSSSSPAGSTPPRTCWPSRPTRSWRSPRGLPPRERTP
jgi:putative transposase